MSNYIDQFGEILSNPLGDLISSIGRGVGEAQAALDAGSLSQTLEIYKEDDKRSDEENNSIRMLREIGYQPTFYVLPETEVEVKVSLSMAVSSAPQNIPIQPAGKRRVQMMATPINAGNTNRYNLNANVATTLKFKIVPVPPASVISELRFVPDLAGKKFTEAKAVLESLGLSYRLAEGTPENLSDEATIISTSPGPDTQVRVGDSVELKFG